MKTKNSVKSKVFMTLALALCSFTGAMANEDAILNSDPIDINGYVQQAPPATDQELERVKGELQRQKNAIIINKAKKKKYNELSRTTEKLADETEEMIEERRESQETIDKFNKKIDCLMNNNAGAECAEFVKGGSDTVKVSQAAPVEKVETAVEKTPGKMGDVIKILPYSGFTSIQSENENLEANLTMGLRVESDITERFSVGLGFNYMNMQTTDFANSYQGFYRSGFDYNDLSNFYGGGREAEYTNLSFEIYSKYFITKTERFRPYVGGGISYNRSQLNYLDNRDQQFTYPSGFNNQRVYQFGDEEVISSHMKVNLVGGTEVIFTKNFGLNLELQYARGLGGNLGSDNANLNNAPDQDRLQALSDELMEANLFSVYAGILVLF